MHAYNIEYNTYEENENFQIYHEKKFNEKEFEKIVSQAVINLFQKNTIGKWHSVTFQDIIYEVVKELIQNFGFKKLNFNAEFRVFGWAKILDEKDWGSNRDKQLQNLTKNIQKYVSKVIENEERKV